MRVKILLANEGYLERAGVCMYMYQWSHILATCFPGNTVTVYFRLSVKDEELRRAFESDGTRVVIGNRSVEETSADKGNRDAIKKDLRNILNEGYDIVHVHSSIIGFTTLVLREAMKAKVPMRIAHAHRSEFENGIVRKLLHKALRCYIRRASTLYAGCSRQAGEYIFGKKGVRSDRWKMITNAIDTGKYTYNKSNREARRRELAVGEDVLLLGSIGYLEEVKNHEFLIGVMAGTKKAGIPAKLVVFGNGSLREYLTEKIRTAKLEDTITLYGVTDDIPGWLSAMDCFVMPSLIEGLPLSAVEAQASGLPCLLSDLITDEVDITPLVCHLPVDKGPRNWVEKIADIYHAGKDHGVDSERSGAAKRVAEAGFDRSSLKYEVGELYGLGAPVSLT